MATPESVGLFENDREANLESAIAMIEDVLIELGHFVNDCRIDAPDAHRAWRIRKGSAEVLIKLIERPDYWHIRAVGAVLALDASVDRGALFEHVLRLNHQELHGAAFALNDNHITIVAERSTLDLDRSEVLDLVRRVREFADDWDDKLAAAYGGDIGEDEDLEGFETF